MKTVLATLAQMGPNATMMPGADSPSGTVPIPRLRITLSYRVPAGHAYAVDSFPDQQRKPVTDHVDFENVIPERLRTEVVTCLNAGRTC